MCKYHITIETSKQEFEETIHTLYVINNAPNAAATTDARRNFRETDTELGPYKRYRYHE